MIVLRPHHFLDVIKLYGAGIETFTPDSNYGHDFYRVANLMLMAPDTSVQLVIASDTVCGPCKYNQCGICSDSIDHIPGYSSKEDWNNVIDERLFAELGLHPGMISTVYRLCLQMKMAPQLVPVVWSEDPDKARCQERTLNLKKGLEKYLAKFSAMESEN